MKTMLARTAGYLPVITVVLACAVGATVPAGTPSLSTITTLLWLLGAGGAICLLLRRAIDADDRTRDLATRLAREQDARRSVEEILADTQTVLSKVVRQQESVRDGERARIARDIHDELGQTLLTLRADLSLLQVASNGIHPAVHQQSGAMIVTLDAALQSLRAVVSELRPLALGEGLRSAIERQLEEFTRLNGIAHQLDIGPGPLGEPELAAFEGDALLYRVLQEALADLAHHASATEVRVGLQRSGAALTLRIDDNGRGSRRSQTPCACGLAGMRERVEACGGALRMTAKSDGGMALALMLPCSRGMAAA
jgi:signal transduction histidine kinase